MRRINYLSDIKLLESAPAETTDFIYHFTTDGEECYDVSLALGNCKKVQNPEGEWVLIITLNHHNLPVGRLKCRREMRYADTDFQDDIWNAVTEYVYDILLVDGESDPIGEEEVIGYMPIFRGEKGEKGDGYVLTEEDIEHIAEVATEKIDLSDYYTKEEVDEEVKPYFIPYSHLTKDEEELNGGYWIEQEDVDYIVEHKPNMILVERYTDGKRSYKTQLYNYGFHNDGIPTSYKCMEDPSITIPYKFTLYIDEDNEGYYGVLWGEMWSNEYIKNDAGYLKKSDFKTINGETIVGSGDIEVKGADLMYYEEDEEGNVSVGNDVNRLNLFTNIMTLQHIGESEETFGGIKISDSAVVLEHEGETDDKDVRFVLKDGKAYLNNEILLTYDEYLDRAFENPFTVSYNMFNGQFVSLGWVRVTRTTSSAYGAALTVITTKTVSGDITYYEFKQFLFNKVDDSILTRTAAMQRTKESWGIFTHSPWKKLGGDTYIEGNGIVIEDNTIKIDDTVVATKTDFKTINGESIIGEGDISAKYDDTQLRGIAEDASEKATEALDKIDQLELYKTPNLTLFGDLDIDNGQISNFNEVNYAQFPFLVDFKNKPFTIDICITTNGDLIKQSNIFDSNFGLAFAIRDEHFVIAASDNGESWNLGEHIGTHNVVFGITYYIKISFDRDFISLAYSFDKESYVKDITFASSRTPYPKQIIVGRSISLGDGDYNRFDGIINLNYCSLEIDGVQKWQGMDDVGIATRLATDLSNIDSAGEKKIKEITSLESITTPSKEEQEFTNWLKIDVENDTEEVSSYLHLEQFGNELGLKEINENGYKESKITLAGNRFETKLFARNAYEYFDYGISFGDYGDLSFDYMRDDDYQKLEYMFKISEEGLLYEIHNNNSKLGNEFSHKLLLNKEGLSLDDEKIALESYVDKKLGDVENVLNTIIKG